VVVAGEDLRGASGKGRRAPWTCGCGIGVTVKKSGQGLPLTGERPIVVCSCSVGQKSIEDTLMRSDSAWRRWSYVDARVQLIESRRRSSSSSKVLIPTSNADGAA